MVCLNAEHHHLNNYFLYIVTSRVIYLVVCLGLVLDAASVKAGADFQKLVSCNRGKQNSQGTRTKTPKSPGSCTGVLALKCHTQKTPRCWQELQGISSLFPASKFYRTKHLFIWQSEMVWPPFSCVVRDLIRRRIKSPVVRWQLCPDTFIITSGQNNFIAWISKQLNRSFGENNA